MSTQTSVHGAILAALTGAGVYAVPGPADELPSGSDGRVSQAAVLWPSPRFHGGIRVNGEDSRDTDAVTVICVGATSFDALAVADKVHGALRGLRLSDKGSPLLQLPGAERPEVEPNSDPVRVSLAVEYAAINKGEAVPHGSS